MPTINEQLQNETIAHRVYLASYEIGIARKMVKVLDEADAELSARLLVALDDMPSGSFSISRLNSLLGSVRELNASIVSKYSDSLANELLSFAEYEAGYQLSLFESLMPDSVKNRFPFHSVTPQQVYAAAIAQPFQGRLLREWAENLESDRLTRISNTIRNGYLVGDSTQQIVRKVRGSRDKNYKDGALQASRRNAEAIVRTAISHTASIARDEFASQNESYIKGKKWLSTLDTRTTHICIIRDNKEYTVDNKPVGHKIPYGDGPGRIHFCCRSTETLITKSWREMGIDIDEMPPGTRASMDGQVPADTTYLDWLKKQPAARQDEILGPTRARLMRDGGLSVESFYTDNGKFLTIDKLREIDEKSFSKAGI